MGYGPVTGFLTDFRDFQICVIKKIPGLFHSNFDHKLPDCGGELFFQEQVQLIHICVQIPRDVLSAEIAVLIVLINAKYGFFVSSEY